LIQSLSLKPFVSYLLNIDLFRDLRELLRSDYTLIESLAVMLSTGFTGGAYKLDCRTTYALALPKGGKSFVVLT
jgi:hypothetical protein